MRLKILLAGLLLATTLGCGSTAGGDPGAENSSISPSDGGKHGDGGTVACSLDGAALEAACVHGAWGSGLTTTFGRLDGTISAIATPGSSQCSQSNSGHLILEVTMNGAPYALAVNVYDSMSSAGVYFGETDQPLAGVAWQEGWHTDAAEKLDYPTNLNIHSTAFQAYNKADLVNKIVCELVAGDSVSVFGLGWGPGGAHDIHRNSGGGGADGAIVLHANTAHPHYLMFHFANQTF